MGNIFKKQNNNNYDYDYNYYDYVDNNFTIKHKEYVIPCKYIISSIPTQNTIFIINSVNRTIDDIYKMLVTLKTCCNANIATFEFNLDTLTQKKSSCSKVLKIFMKHMTNNHNINLKNVILCSIADSVDVTLKYYNNHNLRNQMILINPPYISPLVCCHEYHIKYKNQAFLMLYEKHKEDIIINYCEKTKNNNVKITNPENVNHDLCNLANAIFLKNNTKK